MIGVVERRLVVAGGVRISGSRADRGVEGRLGPHKGRTWSRSSPDYISLKRRSWNGPVASNRPDAEFLPREE